MEKSQILHRTLATTLTFEEMGLVSGGRDSVLEEYATTRYYWTDRCGGTDADYGRDND